jgi:hypothetical protein
MIIIYLMLNNPSGLFGISLKRVVHSLMIAYASFTSPTFYINLFVFKVFVHLKEMLNFNKCGLISDKFSNEFHIGSDTGTQITFHLALYHLPCGKHQLALLPSHNQET